MTQRVDPAGDSILLVREMRRVIQLRWLAGIAVAIAAIAGRAVWPNPGAWKIGLALGLAVLAYNALFLVALRGATTSPRAGGETGRKANPRTLGALAWLQIALDIAALSIATVGTGGLSGPIAGFFVLHIVLTSLLLSAPQAYVAVLLSLASLLVALGLAGQWPRHADEFLLLGGWLAVLLLTAFLTGRITNDLREQQGSARHQASQLQAVLETAVEGIVTIDIAGTMLSANPAAERIFGYGRGELVGRRVNELMPEPDRSRHDGYIEAYRTTGRPRIIGIGREVIGMRRDGSLVPIDLSISEVRLGDRILFTGILRDITERKRAEEKILSMNEALQRHQQALIQTEKMVAMGQMAAGVVHEIGNPLASMDSLLQLIERHPSRLTDETAGVLREQVARIQRIVRQLTDFAHPNETAWEVRPVNQLVDSTLEMMRFDRRLKSVEVERQLAPDAGSARVMPHAFQQVLVNMIVNAVDAMGETTTPRLVLATGRRGAMCMIEVRDNGHGIAADHLPHVFEPFFTTKPIGRGTGLGLSISYSVIQRHGGDCEIESQLGVGTTFRILLPVAEARA